MSVWLWLPLAIPVGYSAVVILMFRAGWLSKRPR